MQYPERVELSMVLVFDAQFEKHLGINLTILSFVLLGNSCPSLAVMDRFPPSCTSGR